MYKVTKHEYLRRRPGWMISLLLRFQPSLYGKQHSEYKAQVILRYIRIVINMSRIIQNKKRLQLESTPKEVVIKNNHGKVYLSFNIEKTK